MNYRLRGYLGSTVLARHEVFLASNLESISYLGGGKVAVQDKILTSKERHPNFHARRIIEGL